MRPLRAALAADFSAFISALTRDSMSALVRFAAARRTPYENAATLITGPPSVAAKTEVRAETLPVMDST